MKANTPELMKFKKLQRKLGESRRGTIGLLEGLWIEVARNSPAGDIGRFTNEEIAIMVDWDGDPDLLVDSLVECRWLDECSENRLVVHDWHDHCPTYVKGGLAKQRRHIAIATSLEVQAIATSSTESATSSEVVSTKPSQAKPIQAKPSQEGKSDQPNGCAHHLVDFETVASYWNSQMGQDCRQTPKRQTQFAVRIKDAWWRDNWRQAIDAAAQSDFCRGKNDRGWTADLEWFLKPDSADKLIEGKYKSTTENGTGKRSKVSFDEGLLT